MKLLFETLVSKDLFPYKPITSLETLILVLSVDRTDFVWLLIEASCEWNQSLAAIGELVLLVLEILKRILRTYEIPLNL